MKPNDPNFIKSSAPVNSRTVPAQKKQTKVPLQLQKKLLKTRAKHRFGLPLVEQINKPISPVHSISNTKLALISIAFALAGICLLLGAIKSSTLFISLGLFSLSGAGIIAFRQIRQASHIGLPTCAPLFELASLEKFDQALDRVVLEVSEEIAVQLIDLKQQILRLHQLNLGGAINEHFTQEDRMYVVEAVHRYLPDTLQAYLTIPHEQRHQILPQHSHSARQLLSHQIELIANELGKREAKLKQNATDDLIKQQRFLESKIRHHD